MLLGVEMVDSTWGKICTDELNRILASKGVQSDRKQIDIPLQ